MTFSSHLWTLHTYRNTVVLCKAWDSVSSPPILLAEANFTYLPTLVTRGKWRPARWRTWNNQRKPILLRWVCFTKSPTWRVKSHLVRHCKWCFRKHKETFIPVHYCCWDGVTHLPQIRTGVLPSWKHPGWRNLERCDNLLEVLGRSPALPSWHSSFTIGWYSLTGNAKRRSSVLPYCGGDTH